MKRNGKRVGKEAASEPSQPSIASKASICNPSWAGNTNSVRTQSAAQRNRKGWFPARANPSGIRFRARFGPVRASRKPILSLLGPPACDQRSTQGIRELFSHMRRPIPAAESPSRRVAESRVLRFSFWGSLPVLFGPVSVQLGLPGNQF